MKFIAIIIILSILTSLSCKRLSSTSVSIFDSDRDSVTLGLKKLNDSLLTRILIDPYVYYFDTVKQGESFTGRIKIKNAGRQTFKLAQAIVSCECTTLLNEKLTIPANDSAYLSFILNTSGFADGYNERVITILGNFKPYFRSVRIEGYVK